jgi:excisionase family DNA binding protein
VPVKLGDLTLYTLKELSKKLNITTVTLRAYIKEGRLKGRKMGTRWYISEDALREYFEADHTSSPKR